MSSPDAPRALSATQIIERLERSGVALHQAALAFDADGTLWSGDVGEAACQTAIEQQLIREAARGPLERDAAEFGLSTRGTPSELTARLLEAFRNGRYSELRACEMMVWCYAGFSEDELRQHVRQTLARRMSGVVPYRPLLPIVEWARARGVRCVVISASPQLVVEEAARPLGFAAEDVAAGRAEHADGIIQPMLSCPIPYAEMKAAAGRALLDGRAWLATFGDNAFDTAMLRQAWLPVAVRPTRRLRDVLGTVPGAVLFREN